MQFNSKQFCMWRCLSRLSDAIRNPSQRSLTKAREMNKPSLKLCSIQNVCPLNGVEKSEFVHNFKEMEQEYGAIIWGEERALGQSQ